MNGFQWSRNHRWKSLQNQDLHDGIDRARSSINHAKNKADSVEQGLGDVDAQEEAGAEGASGALDNADDIENQA